MAFDLSSITRGKRLRAPKVVVYGPPKVGKSTFAASAPGSIGIITEEGIDAIDCAAFPKCATFDDVMTCLASLYTEKHEFQTVFVDSLDWLEPLILAAVAKEHKVANVEDIPYGKGYGYAEDKWRAFFAGLDALRNDKGMIVVCIAHEQVSKVRNPALAEDYDAYSLKLNKRATKIVEEWADVIGFAAHKVLTRTVTGGFNQKETKAVSTGERVLYLNANPAYVAGNRYGIPDVPLNWQAFSTALTAAMNPPAKAA